MVAADCESFFEQSDVVSLHLRLVDQTLVGIYERRPGRHAADRVARQHIALPGLDRAGVAVGGSSAWTTGDVRSRFGTGFIGCTRILCSMPVIPIANAD